MKNLNATAIILIVIAIMMKFLINASKKKPAIDSQGNKILKLPRPYEIMGVILFFASLIILIYSIIDFNPKNILYQFIIFVLFGGLGFLLILFGRVYQVTFNDNEISSKSIFGKINTICWKNVKQVKFNQASAKLKINDGMNTIKCHQHLVGFPALVNFLKTKLNITSDQIDLPNY